LGWQLAAPSWIAENGVRKNFIKPSSSDPLDTLSTAWRRTIVPLPAVRVASVNETPPVDVTDVTGAASLDESHWHDRPVLLVLVPELASRQQLAMHQPA
jgi:hypothetical protein